MRKYLAVAAAAVLGVALPASAQTGGGPEGRVVTLDEAIELAIQHSPVITQRSGAVSTASSGERVAFGTYLPSISFSSGAGLASQQRFDPNTATTVSGSSESYSAGLSASVDLFTGGRRGAQLDQARALLDVAEASLVEQRFAVTLQAKRSFFDVLRADESRSIAEARVDRAEQGLTAAENRVRVGSATRSDELRARLELNQARQNLLQAESQRRTTAHVLGALIGVDGPVGARVETSLEPSALAQSRDEIVAAAVERAPTVLNAEANVFAGEAAVRASRAQYFPSLRVSSGYDWSNSQAAFNDGRTSWNLRLGVSYPIFNGFAREDAIERAQVQARTGRAQLEDARRQVRASAERVLALLDLAEQQIELSEEARAVAAEDMRVQEERYRLGVATILDLVTSQIALAEAEQSLVAARYDYQIARAELEALLGRSL